MSKLKERFKKIKLQSVAFAVALVIIGIMFIVFPESSLSVICYVAGAVLALWGVMSVTVFFISGIKRNEGAGLVWGVALICFAVLLLARPDLVTEILTIIFGIALILDGAAKIQQAAIMSHVGAKGRWVVLAFALIAVTLGVILAFNPFSTRHALMIYAGVSLIIAGVCDLLAECFRRPAPVSGEKVIDVE